MKAGEILWWGKYLKIRQINRDFSYIYNMRIAGLILLLLLTASPAGLQTTEGKSAQQIVEIPVDTLELHDSIVKSVSEKKYAYAASLLNRLEKEDPERYQFLPYSLLHAKVYALTENYDRALEQYLKIVDQPELTLFSALPAARIAAAKEKPEMAAQLYQKALKLRDHPEYPILAREALDYCWLVKRATDLHDTAKIVRANPSLRRTADFYIARAHWLRGDRNAAQAAYQQLISNAKEDDITSQALADLDRIDPGRLSEAQAISRGKLAYRVWNFELASKYLGPYAGKSIEETYLYARSLSFLGESAAAKKLLLKAAEKWPNDPFAKLSLNQYGNVCLRNGDYRGAAEVFRKLRKSGLSMDDYTFKLIFALRAQSKFKEALALIDPYTRAKKKADRQRAVFLRGRTLYQSGLYREAFTDFDKLFKEAALNTKEILLWKGIALEKMGQPDEAIKAFQQIADGHDFFSFIAAEKLVKAGYQPEAAGAAIGELKLCTLPTKSDESKISELWSSGDHSPALLYLGMYEEAAQILTRISYSGWTLMGIDPSNRREKFLSLSYLASLGHNYPTATYYSELFLKSIPDKAPLFSESADVLKALFPLPYHEPVSRFSQERQIDPLFVLSIMKQESKFKRQARSPAFARGLMQLIPSTASKVASDLGIKNFSLDQLYHPEVNINLGTKYIKDLASRFGNKPEVIAAGYNSGESNVQRWLDCTSSEEILEFYSNIDLPETKNYVQIVKTNYESYRRIYYVNGRESAKLSSGLE